jgi:hypothetical protein
MKVGILTFHDGINYGAFFQVYALQSFLIQHGFECQVINYKSPGFTIREYRCFLDPMHIPKRRIIRNVAKIRRFKAAHHRLHLTDRIFRENKLASLYFDCIVIGSDEVWNFGTKLIGYDPVYFSRGLNAGRFISYAASFGSIKSHEAVPEELRNCLARIERVSVRDENSANIIRAISDKPVQVVLDPMLLFDLKPQAITPREHGFILVYGFFTAKMKSQVLEYARSMGKKTISIGYSIPWCDASLDALSPFEWLGYFATCDCVITTMYHGMISSLLYQKEFCMFVSPYRENKLGNFPSAMGLSNRFIDENRSIENAFADEIDYSRVTAQIDTWRRESEAFLLGAIQS